MSSERNLTCKFYRTLILLIPAFALYSCASTPQAPKRPAAIVRDTSQGPVDKKVVVNHFDTTFSIGKCFEISYHEIDINRLLTVQYNHKDIYRDCSDEYILNDSFNPTLIESGTDCYQVFLEVSDAPNKSYLKMLTIQKDKVVDSQRTPTFPHKPCRLFGDTTLVYAAAWDNSEEWEDSNGKTMVTCDPIMYYKLTKKGLVLDSLYTIKKNREIFGITDAFKLKELKSIPLERVERNKEFNRIFDCN